MPACHAAGLGSIPGRDKFPGVFTHLYDKCQETLGPQGPRILFCRHNRTHIRLVRMSE